MAQGIDAARHEQRRGQQVREGEGVEGALPGRRQRHPGPRIQAAGCQHERATVGDGEYEECRRLEQRHRLTALAVADPAKRGDRQRHKRRDAVEHEVERRRDDAHLQAGHDD